MGEMSVAMDAGGMEASIKIALKDILWTSRVPCRLLSTGTVRHKRRELVDSGMKESYVRLIKIEPTIPRVDEKKFLTLSASIRARKWQQPQWQVSFANEKHRPP